MINGIGQYIIIFLFIIFAIFETYLIIQIGLLKAGVSNIGNEQKKNIIKSKIKKLTSLCYKSFFIFILLVFLLVILIG